MIHAKKEMIQLKVINLLGLLSILITLILTLTGFQVFTSRMQIQQRNFKYINWLYQINFQISQAFSEQNIKYLQLQGLWNLNQQDSKTFLDLLNKLLNRRYKLANDLLIAQQNCTDPEIQVFQIIKDKRVDQKAFYDLTKFGTINVSLLYSLEMQVGVIYHIVSEQDPNRVYRKNGQMNYPVINSLLTDINAEISASYEQQLSEIQNQTQVQLFVVMSVSFVFLMSIIPSYQFSKMKQQQVMELFATFDPKYLKDILTRIFSQIGNAGFSDKASQMLTKLSQSNFVASEGSVHFDMSAHVTKKMNISRTSKLNYSVKLLAFSLFTLFSCIMVYPITNFFVVQKFMDNSKLIFNFNDIMTDVYFTMVNTLRARQGVSIGFLLPAYAGLSLSNFQDIFEQQIPIIQDQMQRLQDNISLVKESTMYNESTVKGFLINLFETNGCQTLLDYPEYTYSNFEIDKCKSVSRGVLNQGLFLGLKSFFLRAKDHFDFIYQYDAQSYQKYFNLYNQATSGLAQLMFKDQITVQLDYVLGFLYDQNNQLYDYYQLVSIFMLIQQLALIVLLYFFGWRLYYKSINQVIFNTKDLLDIFPSVILLQNSYIMSFLKKNE